MLIQSFSYVGMPQGFDLNSAFIEQQNRAIVTKNTEIRENYDKDRSISGIEDPIRGIFNNVTVRPPDLKFQKLESRSVESKNTPAKKCTTRPTLVNNQWLQ